MFIVALEVKEDKWKTQTFKRFSLILITFQKHPFCRSSINCPFPHESCTKIWVSYDDNNLEIIELLNKCCYKWNFQTFTV